MTPPLTDQELIARCRAGDADAWEHLLQSYERLVFSIPLSYGLSRDEAADITQLTFTALIQALDNLSADSRLGPWLATVARRHSWRALAYQRRHSTADLATIDAAALVDRDSDAPLERWELVEWLHSGLSRLDERCRTLLIVLYFEGHEPSYAEVAASLGIPVGSIGPTRARCLEQLRRTLRDLS
ncbi:MAG: sigma-70 family RNA polymerase sigma factor [Chloroflexales bacterium]|nr:sigma-70 family RNA polymerase sigma factor [Chloroflexales bacterium]